MRKWIGAIALICTGVLFTCSAPIYAASIDSLSIEPKVATSNSIRTISFVWKDDDDRLPAAGSLQIKCGEKGQLLVLDQILDADGVSLDLSDGEQPSKGRKYKVQMTAGLLFPNIPVSEVAGRRVHPEDRYLLYCPDLRTKDDGKPLNIKLKVFATITTPPAEEGGEPTVENFERESGEITIYDSYAPWWIRSLFNPDGDPLFSPDAYGGWEGDRDLLGAYAEYPESITKDPLNTYGPGGDSPDDHFNPDDGTSSTTFTFKVIYANSENLPPVQYIPDGMFSDGWNPLPDMRINSFTGEPYDWYDIKDSWYWRKKLSAGVVLYLAPEDSDEYIILPMEKEDPEDNDYSDGVVYTFSFEPSGLWNDYRSLPNGRYKYFFGCTDDFIRDREDKIPVWLDTRALGDPFEDDCNSWLYERIGNSWNACFSYDVLCYVDRPSYQPGVSSVYWYPSTKHPVVSLSLGGPITSLSRLGLYDQTRSTGNSSTVKPAKTAINPLGGGWTSGTTSDAELYFQIEYSQIDGTAAEPDGEISVWIDKGTTSERRYTLRRTDILGTDVKQGVLYRTSTPVRLSPGEHLYCFTASDGQRRVHYPTVGTTASNRSIYVNNRPELAGGKVTPAMGTAGDMFTFEVTYTDKDNQRPYQASVVIKYGDGPNDFERASMRKKDVTDSDYTDGCVYIFESANLAHKLQPGWRKFYFEFMDDWGWRNDPNVRIPGEKVFYPGELVWVDGPHITENRRPVLINGTVMSEDGTSNAATLWTYKVRYQDADNHSPSYMNLYIGKAEKDDEGKVTAITWDYGHPMAEANPNDTLYTDGKDYVYPTRLPSVAAGDTYYYAFVASDGIDVALWDPTTSPTAHSIFDPTVKPPFEGEYPLGIEHILPNPDSGDMIFQTVHYPLVGEIPLTPTNKLYRYPIVFDSTGSKLRYELVPPDYTVDFVNGVITLAKSGDFIDVQYWFSVEGPVVLNANTSPSLENGQVTPHIGGSSDGFTFSVIYKDPDGLYGQAPAFVHVKVDGQEFVMAPAISGVPNYKLGIRYQVSTRLGLGSHQHYFEASDGTAYAIFDRNGGRSSEQVIVDYLPILGPYVNDRPTLTEGTVFPRGSITIAQGVSYSVLYTDSSNEPPDPGYPVAYVDNPTEVDRSGKATAVSASTITDSSKSWTSNAFKGMPLQMIDGPAQGQVYRIESNTTTTITVIASNLVGDGVQVDNEFSIGRLMMKKAQNDDNTYTDGVLYLMQVPSLGEGMHRAHFKSITTEVIGEGSPRQTTLREPTIGEIEGPTVTGAAPPGNRRPTLSNKSVTPATGRTSDTFTFTVTYSDLDADPPEWHEGVMGYVRLVIDNQNVYPMTPPSMPDYGTGAVMTCAVNNLSGGTHRYHFEASDGYFAARLPESISQFYTLKVNQRPVLSQPAVTPTRGNEGQPFTYTVKYTDLDNDAPASIKLWIDHCDESEAIDLRDHAVLPPGARYSDGVLYSYTLPAGTLKVDEEHNFYFTANDGMEDAVQTPEGSGPVVHPNLAPSLGQGAVAPDSGWNTDTYTYSVVYTDPDGDEPEYVRVYIDGSDEADAHLMTKEAGDDDFENGVTYTFQTQSLSAGSHTYFFEASDWMEIATDPGSGTKSGPEVSQRPTATITIQCSASPRVGQATTISGTISPAMPVPLAIKFTRPNGTTFERSVSAQVNGSYSHSWTPDLSGTWKLVTTWAGGGSYAFSSSPELAVVVDGPSLTVTGLNMISLPLQPSSTYPDGCFGRTPPFALAKWQSSSGAYKLYSLLPGYTTDYDFPLIATGQGYWIKTLEPKLIAPAGTLVSTSLNFSIPLEAGWNQIGSPFLQETAWGNLQVRYGSQTVSLGTAHANGWVREYGWSYDPSAGNYKLADATRSGADRTMRPWLGYWIRALVSCQLIIPAPGGGTEPPPPPPSPSGQSSGVGTQGTGKSSPAQWEVRIIATNGSLKDSAFFGLNSSKAERIESPACIEGYVDVYFTDDQDSIYASDVRAKLSSGDAWRVKVATDSPGDVELAWEGLENLPGNVRLALVDDQDNTSTELTPGSSYKFRAEPGYMSRPFRILFETK